MVKGRAQGYRELLLLVARAAGLTGLAVATQGSACGSCDEHDECATIGDLVATRDEGMARSGAGGSSAGGSAGATSAGGSAGSSTFAMNLTTAQSWDASSCPTPEQYKAIVRLKFPDRYQVGTVTPTELSEGKCCYHVQIWCGGGRPFLVDGESRVASLRCDDTSTLDTTDASKPSWLVDAQLEHASVASFARLTLQLLAHGAPAELIAEAQRAALDELRHADFFFELASKQAGFALRPGLLDVSGALQDLSLAGLVESNLREGCIGETSAAADLRQRAELVDDPALRASLLAIADDEARHAALAFRILAWCRDTDPELTRSIAARVLSEELVGLSKEPAATTAPHRAALSTS